jgi:serine/threonine protein kinase
MGAVVSSGHDPMLVMEYMEYGSLHDLLHSETMFFSGEICLQILRDIAQGLRYLHASKPPILHGDLKGSYIRRVVTNVLHFTFCSPPRCAQIWYVRSQKHSGRLPIQG